MSTTILNRINLKSVLLKLTKNDNKKLMNSKGTLYIISNIYLIQNRKKNLGNLVDIENYVVIV